jgi:hypothetical protein
MRFATPVPFVALATDSRRTWDAVMGDTTLRAGIETI